MKPWITTFFISIAFSYSGALAQDSKPPGREVPVESMEKQLRIQIEWIELSHVDFTALMEENDSVKPLTRKSSNDGALRGKLKKMIEEGKAEILDTAIVMARSGQRAKVESVKEVIYPTEFIPPGVVETGKKEKELESEADDKTDDGGKDKVALLPTASAYETRNVGTTLEVDPVLGVDERTINLSLSPEIVYHVGQEEYGIYKDGESEVIAKMPLFHTMKVTTQVTTIVGEYSFIAVNSPFQMEEGTLEREQKIMVFVKVDLLYVGLPAEGGK